MSAEEKEIGWVIMEVVSIMHEEGRKYILDYAEGVIAMAGALQDAQVQDSA